MKKLLIYMTALLITLGTVQVYAQCCPSLSGGQKTDKTTSKEDVKDDKQVSETTGENTQTAPAQQDTQKKDN